MQKTSPPRRRPLGRDAAYSARKTADSACAAAYWMRQSADSACAAAYWMRQTADSACAAAYWMRQSADSACAAAYWMRQTADSATSSAYRVRQVAYRWEPVPENLAEHHPESSGHASRYERGVSFHGYAPPMTRINLVWCLCFPILGKTPDCIADRRCLYNDAWMPTR